MAEENKQGTTQRKIKLKAGVVTYKNQKVDLRKKTKKELEVMAKDDQCPFVVYE